jgi:hypothetical protein
VAGIPPFKRVKKPDKVFNFGSKYTLSVDVNKKNKREGIKDKV